MSMKIYSYPQNPRVYKALIAAKYVGVEIEVPAFDFQKDSKSAEFLKVAPHGKVPVMVTEKGSIFESNSIARYVARLGGKIYGSDAYEASVIDQWLDFATNEVEASAVAWLYPIMGFVKFNPEATQKAKENVKRLLTTLDNHLKTSSFLVGPRVSLADIVVACSLSTFYTMVFDPSFRSPFVNVNRWFTTCINQPNFKSVMGEVKFATVMAEAKKEEKPKKEAAPKPEPKKEAPKKEVVAKNDDEEEDEAPRKQHPLSILPPSKFNLEEWKRMYSNNETRAVALPWFWQNFDSEGFSVFLSTYKYNEELGQLFMTSNLIGGFFQRLETLHKYAFCSMLITGEDDGKKDQEISGVWIFRGKGLPADLLDCDDNLVYDWKELDVSDATTKTLVEDYFAWDGLLGGKKFLQGKLYK
ncbi:glutathione S-transferase domain-containing protein [Cavenderia fasciculata]|uniref:Glutathione S-transferase domain-containing protein n=1 Tax=Cavenderia fasciculata TaxID=261658 RepID=F4QCX4_CACFS|nr:glutathione S-transferase domain-containing protein [Cavenderia fasciculata]EGG14498.1 glutathione S-transferase domain-containing protein [Cavenderia fasciculata]|eukprot:XP_004353907.1 glutathione S-transferase domain-containing protein [Cavenderia fasciculata]